MVRLLKALWFLCAVTGIAAIAGVLWFASQGISARQEPGKLEASVARTARTYAIPRADRDRANPIEKTRGSVRAGLAHWADHCATCHGNDGSGDTSMGRGLYPRAPDMRRPDTQNLTDGELFYIIENGVKLTGMPAWATDTPEGEQDSWHLVNFIRHLPDLTEEERSELEDLNPRGPAEWRALEEERKFLAGEIDAPPVQETPQGHDAHKGGHK
jgi:mono/diheme cytochrome c family protein